MALRSLFKHTLFYGLATVLPRALSFLLTPFYVSFLPSRSDFGLYSGIMAYLIFGNVLLSYGMETAFFRFANLPEHKAAASRTALTCILISSLAVLAMGLAFSAPLASYMEYKPIYVSDMACILALDALLAIPFAYLRNQGRSRSFAYIKLANVGVNVLLNVLFIVVLKDVWFSKSDPVHLVLLALLMSSFISLLMTLPVYKRVGLGLDLPLLRRMLRYAFPVLIAGLAFAVNEGIDRLMLRYMLPADTADAEVGVYSACYKLGAFMTLFATAFKLGIEPLFFQQAQSKDASKTYAQITYYFTVLGCLILLTVCVFIEPIKRLVIPNRTYWEGLWIVPLILIANLFLGIYNNLSVWYKITDRTVYGAVFSIVAAICTLCLNLTLIPIIGYRGCAIATLVAYGLMMMLSFLIGQRVHRIAYPLRKIGLLMGVSIGFSLISFYIFAGNHYVGGCFFLLFILELYLLEKKLFNRLLKRS